MTISLLLEVWTFIAPVLISAIIIGIILFYPWPMSEPIDKEPPVKSKESITEAVIAGCACIALLGILCLFF